MRHVSANQGSRWGFEIISHNQGLGQGVANYASPGRGDAYMYSLAYAAAAAAAVSAARRNWFSLSFQNHMRYQFDFKNGDTIGLGNSVDRGIVRLD